MQANEKSAKEWFTNNYHAFVYFTIPLVAFVILLAVTRRMKPKHPSGYAKL